jgi:hypothetical protein
MVSRLTLAAFAVASVCTATTAAVHVDAKDLVLQPSDVPAGFELDAQATRYWSSAAFANGRPELRKVVRRSGRLSGYSATYNARSSNRVRTIISLSHLFRDARGAGVLLSYISTDQRALNADRVKQGSRRYRSTRLGIGAEGWVYWSIGKPSTVFAFWRSRRSVAAISSWGVGLRQTTELARAQQRNIDRALGD